MGEPFAAGSPHWRPTWPEPTPLVGATEATRLGGADGVAPSICEIVANWYPDALSEVIMSGSAPGVPDAPAPTCISTIAPGTAPETTRSRIAADDNPCQSSVSMVHMIVWP